MLMWIANLQMGGSADESAPADPYVSYYNGNRKQIGRHLHHSIRRGRYKHRL